MAGTDHPCVHANPIVSAQHMLAHWTLKTTWELGTVGSIPTQ